MMRDKYIKAGVYYIITMFLLSVHSYNCEAQALSWQHQMTNETGLTKRHSETTDGKILLLSTTTDSITDNIYSTLVKCDTNGTVLWIYRFGNLYHEFSNISETPDSGCVFAFAEIPESGNTKDIHLVHLDAAGTELLSRVIHLPSSYVAINTTLRILARNSGGYFLSTIITDSTTATSFLNIMLLDSGGNIQWSNLYGTQRAQLNVPCLDTTVNGDLLVANSVIELPSNNVCYALTRINPNGNLQWSKYFQSNNYDLHVCSMESTGLDSFYITGTCQIPFTTYPETCVMLINGNGAMFWFNRYGLPGVQMNTNDAAANPNDHLAFVAYGTDSATQPGSIAGVVAPSGQLLVSKFFHWYDFTSIDYAGFNSFSVSGGGTTPAWHSTYMRLDSQLTACNDANVSLLTNSVPVSVSTGLGVNTLPSISSADTLIHSLPGITLVYGCAPDGINEITSVPITVFPNPAKEEFTLNSSTGPVVVRIFNAQGKLIQAMPVIGTTATINCSGWETGVYFIQSITDEKVYTLKIVIQ